MHTFTFGSWAYSWSWGAIAGGSPGGATGCSEQHRMLTEALKAFRDKKQSLFELDSSHLFSRKIVLNKIIFTCSKNSKRLRWSNFILSSSEEQKYKKLSQCHTIIKKCYNFQKWLGKSKDGPSAPKINVDLNYRRESPTDIGLDLKWLFQLLKAYFSRAEISLSHLRLRVVSISTKSSQPPPLGKTKVRQGPPFVV